MEHASRFHVLEHAPQRGWCRKRRASPERNLLSDFTRNLVVVGRQPHPDPNFASYVLPGRPHRLTVALPEDLASYGPLPGLLGAAASLLSIARLWTSQCCCVLFTAAFLLQSFYPLPLLVILAPFILFIVRFI